MKRFVDGVDCSQGLLLRDPLDDYVHDDNPVRVVDAFVEALDIGALGFAAATPPAAESLPIIRRYCLRFIPTDTLRLLRERGAEVINPRPAHRSAYAVGPRASGDWSPKRLLGGRQQSVMTG